MWASPPEELELDADCIDVWRTEIDLPADEINSYALTLSKEEQQRAAKFTFPDKYKEYVVSRGLLRKALAHTLKQAVSEFQFEYTDSKKPYLSMKYANKTISFNISHSHGKALAAVSLDRNIGIDIEKIRADVKYEKLAKRFFSDAEHSQLMQLPADQRARSFFAIWTRKEAFVKAIGKGIAFGLSEFDVNISPEEPPVMLETRWNPNDVSKWLMTTVETDDNYFATLIADGGQYQVRYWEQY